MLARSRPERRWSRLRAQLQSSLCGFTLMGRPSYEPFSTFSAAHVSGRLLNAATVGLRGRILGSQTTTWLGFWLSWQPVPTLVRPIRRSNRRALVLL